MPLLNSDPEPVLGPRETSPRTWTVVIPVKPAAKGKTRLALPPSDRRAIARAIALDTVAAAAGSVAVARVFVVTSDGPLTALLASGDSVTVLRDGTDGLSAAIEYGLSATDPGRPRAVLLGDLPALKPTELSAALALSMRHDLAFVPDADGTGTVLVTARPGVPLHPRFGADSAAAHRRAGFAELDLPAVSGLRRDLDTAAHLRTLRQLGLGSHTAALTG